MTTAWRIPLCAHVCTPEDAPAAARASVYLSEAADGHDKAQLLQRKHRVLKDGPYRAALWHGYWELNKWVEDQFEKVIQRGALLHYGNPKAVAIADQVSRFNLQKTLGRLEATAC